MLKVKWYSRQMQPHAIRDLSYQGPETALHACQHAKRSVVIFGIIEYTRKPPHVISKYDACCSSRAGLTD